LLLHDDAWSHTAHATVVEIKDLHFECLPHPPFSTDLAPSDFHVFGALKEKLLEASLGLMKKFKRQCMTGCARNLRFFFLRGIQALVKHQNKCIECNGDFVEE
jgi:hypothetical protein